MKNQQGNLRSIVVVAMAGGLVFLAACGGGQGKPATDVDDQPWEVRLESPLDTVTVTQGEDLEDKDVLDPPEGPVVNQPVVKETTPPNATPIPSQPTKTFTPGWRVQVFASPSMSAAETEAEVARQKFSEPVYLEYEPPYYKVRVGDFLTKDAAKSLSNRAKSQGYDGAWIVETMVVRPQG
jgi:hypothetical protein